MGVSENGGTPKSSILMGFSIKNHIFWGTTIFGNAHMVNEQNSVYKLIFVNFPSVFKRLFSNHRCGILWIKKNFHLHIHPVEHLSLNLRCKTGVESAEFFLGQFPDGNVWKNLGISLLNNNQNSRGNRGKIDSFSGPLQPQDGKSGRDLGFSTHLKQTKDETTAAMSLVSTRLGDLQRGIWRGRNPEGLRSGHGDMACLKRFPDDVICELSHDHLVLNMYGKAIAVSTSSSSSSSSSWSSSSSMTMTIESLSFSS